MKSLKLKPFVLLISLVLVFAVNTKSQDLQSAINLTKNEQYDEAEAAFQKLIQSEPKNSKNYFFYGENILLNYFADTISNSLKIATDQAREIYNKGIAADSINPLNYIGLAKVAFYLDDNQAADKFRKKAKRLLPPYKKVSKIVNPQDYAFTLAKLAESYIKDEKVDSSKAMPLLREALSIDSKNFEIYIILGDVYYLVKDGSNSIRNYNIAQKFNDKSPTANMKIGSIYMKSKNLMAAIPYYEQAINLRSTYAPAYRELGQLYSMAGKYEKSKEYFKTYLELTKGNIPAKIRYVNALFYAKEYDEVVKNVEEIFAIDQSRTYLNRIAAYSSFEKNPPAYEKALAYMDKLFKDLPEERIIKKDYTYYAKILLKKNANYPKMVQDTARLNRDLQRNIDRMADAKKPEIKAKYKSQIDTLNVKIADLTDQISKADVEINKAFEAYEKALTATPDDKALLYEVAVSYYNYKRFIESAKTFEKLAALGKNDVTDLMQIGRAYYQGKSYTKADSIYNLVLQKDPEYIPAYVAIANAYAAMDPDTKEGLAKPKFEVVIQKTRVDSVKNANELYDAYRYMGYYYFTNKDYTKSKNYYDLMINLDPNNKDFKVKAYNALGFMYFSMGEYTKAIETYKKTLEIDPSNQTATVSIKNAEITIANAEAAKYKNQHHGTVVDASGQPIANASVRVRDTAAEVWTNAKGEFAFEIPKGSEAFIVSAKGYKTKEILVSKTMKYTITLEQ